MLRQINYAFNVNVKPEHSILDRRLKEKNVKKNVKPKTSPKIARIIKSSISHLTVYKVKI